MPDPTVTLTTRLPLDVFERLRALATSADRSMNYLVRVALDRYLAAIAEEEAKS